MRVQAADGRVHVVRAGRVGLTVDDPPAELAKALVERLHDVLEVDEQGVRREAGGLPAPLVGVLGHGRAFVLRNVAEAERKPSLLAEALWAHLVSADARRDRQLAALYRLLDDRRRVVDVAGRENDARAAAQQAQCTRLRLRRVVVLRVAGLDLKLCASLCVDLPDTDHRRRQSRVVEGRHLALAVERPADDDRLLRRRTGGVPTGGAGDSDDRRSHRQERRQGTPPRRSSHYALLCRPTASNEGI